MGSKLLRAGDTERGFAGWINRRFDRLRNRYAQTLSGTLRYRPVVLVLWAVVTLLIVPFYMFSQRELAPAEDQGVVFGIVQAAANSTVDQTKLFTQQVHDVYRSIPEAASIFQITSPSAGFGGMVTKPWSERTKTAQQLLMESMGPLSKIPGIRVIPLTPPALPGGGDFPVDLVIASAAEPERLQDLAHQLVQKAFGSGMFIFADADVKFDQPQTEVVFDRDKLRSQGVDLSQAGRDLSTLLGGDYVNRFSIQGRSYKVIPQVKRTERLTPDQLSDMYITGAENKLVPLSTFATLRTTTEPRELKKFQQLNAVRIQGVIPPPVPLDQALSFLENEARQILPQGFTIDYAGESRQLRTEGGKFLGVFLLSAVLIYLVLAAQFESFRDPFIILAGLGPVGGLGRPAVLVPGIDDAEHLQPGWTHHARRPGGKERDPDRGVRESPARGRRGQAPRRRRSGQHAAPSDPDDDGRDGGGAHAADLCDGSWRRRAQQHRHHARDRHDHRLGIHAVRRAVDLRAGRAHASGGRTGGAQRERVGAGRAERDLIIYRRS